MDSGIYAGNYANEMLQVRPLTLPTTDTDIHSIQQPAILANWQFIVHQTGTYSSSIRGRAASFLSFLFHSSECRVNEIAGIEWIDRCAVTCYRMHDQQVVLRERCRIDYIVPNIIKHRHFTFHCFHNLHKLLLSSNVTYVINNNVIIIVDEDTYDV